MQRSLRAESSRDAITKSSRRKSLKSLLQIPVSARSSLYRSFPASNPVGSIPEDIIREIVDLLAPIDILNFSLASTRLRALLLPALYDTVVLKSSRKCRITLKMLIRRPDICRYIKKLAVRPNYYLAWPRADEYLDEMWVVSKIGRIAPDLTSLNTFDWDGLELPRDHLWQTLRLCCPQLKNVFTNIGTYPLEQDSQLFNFTDLTSFSLIVRHGLGGTELFPPLEELPERFWTMVTKNCPDLEELAICSFSSSSRVFDFERITDAQWPKLHTLTLGSFGYQSDFSIGPPNYIGLGQFLNGHKSLKYIRFLWNFKRWMSPDEIPMQLTAGALPELDTFIGVYQQLAGLPNPGSLETLDLTCEPIYESRIGTVCTILKSLTGLTSLDIWTQVFDHNRDHSHFFRSILESVPSLTDFHFMCTTTFSGRPFKQLISQLPLLPSLKRFSLTKGHKYTDDSMLETALHILKYNPRLKQINIRWAREKCPNHLKQEGSYDVVPGMTEEEAIFVPKDAYHVSGEKSDGITVRIWADGKDTMPKALIAVERGIPLMGPPFERKFRYEIDPQTLWSRIGRMKVVRMLRM